MAGEAAAVAVAIAQKRIVRHFEEADATAPERAIAFSPRDRRLDRRVLGRMQQHGAIRETAAGTLYLDRDGLAHYRSAMRRRVLGLTALMAGVAAVFAAVS